MPPLPSQHPHQKTKLSIWPSWEPTFCFCQLLPHTYSTLNFRVCLSAVSLLHPIYPLVSLLSSSGKCPPRSAYFVLSGLLGGALLCLSVTFYKSQVGTLLGTSHSFLFHLLVGAWTNRGLLLDSSTFTCFVKPLFFLRLKDSIKP